MIFTIMVLKVKNGGGVITKNRANVIKRRFKAYNRMTPKEKDKFIDNIYKLNSSKRDFHDNRMEVNYHRKRKSKNRFNNKKAI